MTDLVRLCQVVWGVSEHIRFSLKRIRVSVWVVIAATCGSRLIRQKEDTNFIASRAGRCKDHQLD